MTTLERNVGRLRRWYEQSVGPFLERMEHSRKTELDRDLERIVKRSESLCKPLAACFIGGSGVGKSTLINALVGRDQVVVPSGGVGPLTAQALEIEFGDEPSLRAFYHAPKMLWQVIFALDQTLIRELGQASDPAKAELKKDIDADTLYDVEDRLSSEDAPKQTKSQQLFKQAQLLVTGRQDGSLDKPYLVDCLLEVIGKPRKWKTSLSEEDAGRIARLKWIFDTKEVKAESCSEKAGHDQGFYEELRDHASGFLAPAIKSLELSWNSELLRSGLKLVDLPGVGIAGDLYREITYDWMRRDADVVVLVVDHRGIRESDADLLRSSEFLNRFLHSTDDPAADPVSLIVAVVKTDEIADERRAHDKSKRKNEHLTDVMNECREVVRSQIRDRLRDAWSLTGSELTDTKREIIDRLSSDLQIYPVSSIQFRRLLAGDQDDPAFISDEEESGIPQFSDGLASLAERHRRDCETRFKDALSQYKRQLVSTLDLLRARWEEGTRASEEVEALRRELEEFLQPLQKEFSNRQGNFRSFLKETLPARIAELVADSRHASGKAIRKYLRTLQDAHWSTLRAAVRRDGTFFGSRHIDLPRDFAQTFEEPIAEAWSKTILKELRQRTKEFADDCIALVEQMVSWAKDQGSRVQPKLIEAQQEAIQTDAKRLANVGREMVNELRDRVKHELVKEIEGPIRRKCQAFVKRNDDVGTGVKRRILELFDELADDAIDAAFLPAKRVLLDNYESIEAEIRDVFKAHQNPLESAEAAIVSSHADYVKRSDAQKRGRVLQDIDAILGDKPDLTDAVEYEPAEV